MSPHYVADAMIAQLRTKYCCAAWNEGCNCGDIADRIEAQAAEIERLREALEQIAAKNDLSDARYDEIEFHARGNLYECELIAFAALEPRT
jgi:hypothetical protein